MRALFSGVRKRFWVLVAVPLGWLIAWYFWASLEETALSLVNAVLDVSGVRDALTRMIVWSFDHPILASFVLALVTFSVVSALAYLDTRRARMDRKSAPSGESNTADWASIANGLKHLRSDATNAHLIFVGAQRPVLERLRGAFGLAGWETTFIPSAFDERGQGGYGQYFAGTEVRGHNPLLVQDVAALLRSAGMHKVFTKVEPLSIPADNPKWPRLQGRVTVLIGYPDD